MKKECIIICGGGGKTTIYNKYPTLFFDIDDFIWNYENQKMKKELETYILSENNTAISKMYQYEMENNDVLRNDTRIILCHHPENAKWLNRNITGIYRPSKELHIKNISDRTPYLQQLSIQDWESLSTYNPIEYSSFEELYNLIPS
jgi:hypothetical protein